MPPSEYSVLSELYGDLRRVSHGGGDVGNVSLRWGACAGEVGAALGARLACVWRVIIAHIPEQCSCTCVPSLYHLWFCSTFHVLETMRDLHPSPNATLPCALIQKYVTNII